MNSSQGRRGRQEKAGRGKREEILAAATERFGRQGYEHTKWADIARDVGVGPTALYHYFESKQHCLYEIMNEALEDFGNRFAAITAEEPDPGRALASTLRSCFELSEHDVLRNRVLVAEQGLLSVPSTSKREEGARQAARGRTRDLELAWMNLLAEAMRVGAIPDDDPRLLARAVLGLYNSIWHWYRPNGIAPLSRVADEFTHLTLAMVGLPSGTQEPERAAA